MVAHDAANLAMGVFGIYVVQLPFSGDLAGRGGARDTALAKVRTSNRQSSLLTGRGAAEGGSSGCEGMTIWEIAQGAC